MLSIVGSDEQWRHPVPLAKVSPWLIQATIAVEDQRFRRHPGVDAWAILRAVGQNLRAGAIVSGASTLDMQLCRMMDGRPRTCRAKAIEAFRAMQLNRLLSKEQILETYLNAAPYGGNVQGAEAASLKYFNKRAKELSLAEAALLAGLPQSPSRYRPDRNPNAALERQRVVLRRMLEDGVIVERQYAEALSCPVAICKSPRDAPGNPCGLPGVASQTGGRADDHRSGHPGPGGAAGRRASRNVAEGHRSGRGRHRRGGIGHCSHVGLGRSRRSRGWPGERRARPTQSRLGVEALPLRRGL